MEVNKLLTFVSTSAVLLPLTFIVKKCPPSLSDGICISPNLSPWLEGIIYGMAFMLIIAIIYILIDIMTKKEN
jgi:hypothetical protein